MTDQEELNTVLAGLVHERGALGQAWFSGLGRDGLVDKEHRYLLLRGGELGDGLPMVVYVMLNPSTADADQNDPTIAKCIKFAAKFMEGRPHRVAIVNLYAIRATDPDDAFKHPRRIGGLQNDQVIAGIVRLADIAIAAWGSDKRSAERGRYVRSLIRTHGVDLQRFGPPSKDGHPKHPLYLKDVTMLEPHA